MCTVLEAWPPSISLAMDSARSIGIANPWVWDWPDEDGDWPDGDWPDGDWPDGNCHHGA